MKERVSGLDHHITRAVVLADPSVSAQLRIP